MAAMEKGSVQLAASSPEQSAAVAGGPSLMQVVELLEKDCRDDLDEQDGADFGFGLDGNDIGHELQHHHHHYHYGTAAATAETDDCGGLDLLATIPTKAVADELTSPSHAGFLTNRGQREFSNDMTATVTNTINSAPMDSTDAFSSMMSRFNFRLASDAAAASRPETASSSTAKINARADPRSPPPAAAMGWTDAPALAVATIPTTATGTLVATVPMDQCPSQPHQHQHQDLHLQSPHHLDILGPDDIEELASGMLDDSEPGNIGQPMSASSSSAAAGIGGVPGNGGGISVAKSWHLGPGAKRDGEGGSSSSIEGGSSSSSGAASTKGGGKGAVGRNTRSNGTISDGCSSGTVSTRMTRSQSLPNGEDSGGAGGGDGGDRVNAVVGSVADVGGDDTGSVSLSVSGKKRRSSSISLSSDGRGGGKSRAPKKKRGAKKSSNAIAKHAAENLKMSHLIPKKPSKGPNSFLRFCSDNRQRVIDESGDPAILTIEVGKILGKEWRTMSDKDREPWTKAAAKAAKEFEVALKKYNTDYNAFVRTKEGKRWIKEQDRLKAGKPTEAEEKERAEKMAAAVAAQAEEEKRVKEQIEEDKLLNLPSPPELPKKPFAFFTECLMERLKSQNGGMSPSNIDDAIPLSIWTQLSREEKAVYQKMANQARTAYRKAMEQYHQVVKAKRKRARDLADA